VGQYSTPMVGQFSMLIDSKTAMSVSDQSLVTSGTVHIAARLTGLMARIEKEPINISVDLCPDPFA